MGPLISFLIALVLATFVATPARATNPVNHTFTFQAVLSNIPDGTYNVDLSFADATSGNNSTQTATGVVVTNGVFSVSVTLPANADQFFYSSSGTPTPTVQVSRIYGANGIDESFPAIPLTTVPSSVVSEKSGFAYTSGSTNALSGVALSSTAPSNGQVLKYNSSSGQWEPGTDLSGSSPITYTGGSGIVVSGSNVISVDTSSVVTLTGGQIPVGLLPTGTSTGQIPLLGAGGKLATSMIPALSTSNLPVGGVTGLVQLSGGLIPNALLNNIPGTSLASQSINSSHIADGSIASSNIGAGVIGATHLVSGSVLPVKLNAINAWNSGNVLSQDGSGHFMWISSGGGGIAAPGTTTSNALVRWNATDGTAVTDSGVTLDASNNMSGIAQLTIAGLTSASANVASLTANQLVATNSSKDLVSKSLSNIGGQDSIIVSGGTGAAVGSNVTVSITTAGSSSNGILTATDWNSFNNRVSTSTMNSNLATKLSKNGDSMSGPLLLSAQNELQLGDASNSHYVAMRAASSGSATYTLTWPAAAPSSSGQVLKTDASGNLSWGTDISGGGITAPGTTTSNALVRWNATDGSAVADSGVTIDSSNNMSGVAQLTVSGLTSASANISSLTANQLVATNSSKNLVSKSLSNISGQDSIAIIGGTSAVVGSNVTVSISTASTSSNGILTSTDWNSFNSRVTSATMTSNLATKLGKSGDSMSGPLLMAGQNELQLGDASNAHYVAMRASSSGSATYTLTWPAAAPSSSGQVLKTDASGNLSWGTDLTGGGSGITAPGTTTSNAIVRWNATDGSAVADSGVLIDSSNNMSGLAQVTATGLTAASANVSGLSANQLVATNSSKDLVSKTLSNITGQDTITITGGTGSVVGSNVTVSISTASAGTSGILTATDWNSFNTRVSTSTMNSNLATKLSKTGDSMTGALLMSAQSELQLSDLSNSHYLSLRAPSSVSSSYTLTWPTSGPSSGQILKSDASGNLSWATDASSTASNITGQDTITITGGSSAVLGSGVAISITTAGTSSNGVLTSTDWNSFNSRVTTAAMNSNLATKLDKTGDSMTGSLLLSNQSELRLGDAANGYYLALRAPSSLSSNLSWTLPNSDGADGQILKWDNSAKTFYWSNDAGSGTGLSGPSTSVTNQSIPRWSNSSGTTLDYSGVVIDNSNNMSGIYALTANTVNGISSTEMGYLSGVTGNLQTQFSNLNTNMANSLTTKLDRAGDTMTGSLTLNSLTASRLVRTNAANTLTSVTANVSDGELSQLVGVTSSLATLLNGSTSNIQTQLNSLSSSVASTYVQKSGDTITGPVNISYESGAGSPALRLGTTQAGLTSPANSGDVMIATASTERLRVTSVGAMYVNRTGGGNAVGLMRMLRSTSLTIGLDSATSVGSISGVTCIDAPTGSGISVSGAQVGDVVQMGWISFPSASASPVGNPNTIVTGWICSTGFMKFHVCSMGGAGGSTNALSGATVNVTVLGYQ